MSELLDDVRREVEEMHAFFTDWFGGRMDRKDYEARFLTRLDPALVYVTPDGHVLGFTELRDSIEQGYGANPAFRIRISDVAVRHEAGDLVLATYAEWQRGARNSANSENARTTTVLLRHGDPFTWLHIHETWRPEAVRAAGAFDF